jgi:hypothetical protein
MSQGSSAAVAQAKLPAARTRVVVVGSRADDHGGRHPLVKSSIWQPTLYLHCTDRQDESRVAYPVPTTGMGVPRYW